LGDLVIQNCDAQGDSFLIALDKRTGNTVWRTARGSRPRGGWATPFLISTRGRQELILNGEFGVRGYDPAQGTELWFCKSFNGRGTPTPAYREGLLYVISGKPGDVYAVRTGGDGDVTSSHMVWHTPRRGGRDLSSPILVDRFLLVVNMAGIGTCYDVTTGKTLWTERLGGAYSASPIAVGDLVYIQDEAGRTLVIKPGTSLEILAENQFGPGEGEVFRSSMAASQGQLFFRSDRAVYCVATGATP
jgi:outer membrane protein assembly factor BamB